MTRILFVTDGGRGHHQSLERPVWEEAEPSARHLPKRRRKEAHRRFRVVLEQTSYAEAKAMPAELERWLHRLNESAADSLREAFEELLTLHRLKVPALLRQPLHSTNPSESMFSTVRDCERNITRCRGSPMAQRW